MAASRRPPRVTAESSAPGSDVPAMAAAEGERKRKEAADEEDDEEERWVGPLPGEAAQAKKRKGKGRSGALLVGAVGSPAGPAGRERPRAEGGCGEPVSSGIRPEGAPEGAPRV